jgi:Protein of unknown function (DUF3800)
VDKWKEFSETASGTTVVTHCENRSVLNVYIDETGDRSNGAKPGNSTVFGMAAILATPESDKVLQAAILKMRAEFGIPDNVVMSSKKHLKSEERRRYAADLLSTIEDIRVVYVYAVKNEISGRYLQNPTLFYNYVAMQTYMRCLWAARNWRGPSEKTRFAFGHVKGHNHESTHSYLMSQAPRKSTIPTHMAVEVKWVSSSKYLSSQAADIYASFLGKLLDPTNTEPYHRELFKQIWEQIRKNNVGCANNLGILSMPRDELFKSQEWNFCLHCQESDSGPREPLGANPK